jgi:ribosomal protein S18 acetylase RimI-like enzyme
VESGSEPFAIIEATESDTAAFARFFLAAWREAGPKAPGFAGATEEVIAELTTVEAVRARVGGPDRRMFLAWHARRVVGFAATKRICDDSVELSGIIVLESQAGLGIGTALVEAGMAAARQDGYREMIVKTETTNARARTFYERTGFHAVGVESEQVGADLVEVSRLSRLL